MIHQLQVCEILQLLKKTPEQAVFDWKSDFAAPNDDEKRGEIIKDIVAIANAISAESGYIAYGVDPRRTDPIIGVSSSYDDSRLQQLVRGKVLPPVEFLYYETIVAPGKVIALIHVQATCRPHIISMNIGKVREGQIPSRRGSSTGGITFYELEAMFRCEPFKITSLEDPILIRIEAHYSELGNEIIKVRPNDKDSRLETGYRLAYWPPGTRREIWIMYANQPELIVMLKPEAE